MERRVTVAAAIIENERGEIFCALRSPAMSRPNLWEFPGGKLEEGGSPAQAARREIAEEFGCQITCSGPEYCRVVHEYDDLIVELVCLPCRLTDAQPRAREHGASLWLPRASLPSLRWAPADRPVVQRLLKEAGLPAD